MTRRNPRDLGQSCNNRRVVSVIDARVRFSDDMDTNHVTILREVHSCRPIVENTLDRLLDRIQFSFVSLTCS
jgi:hypothetical protein